MTIDDDTAPITPAAPATPPTPAAAPSGWRQRMWGLRSVLAVALAGLLLGGAGGAALGYAAHSDDQGGRGGFGGPMRGGFQQGQQGGPGGGQQGFPGAPGGGFQQGVPGQSQPSTAPSDPVQPDPSATTSSAS